MEFYNELTKSTEEFNLDAVQAALRLKDDKYRELERIHRERDISYGYPESYYTVSIEDVIDNDVSFRLYPIKTWDAYNFLHELGRGICSDTINYLYKYNRDIFNQAINDGYKPNDWCIESAIMCESMDEVRRLVRLYGIDVNIISRYICHYDRFNISEEELNRRKSVLRIILEEDNFTWYDKDENPLVKSIISGDVDMSQMLLDYFGVNNLRVNFDELIGLALLHNSIHSSIVVWIQDNFGMRLESKHLGTMLEWRKHKDIVIHSFEDIFEIIEMFDEFSVLAFNKLIRVKFEPEEQTIRERLFESLYNKVHDEMDIASIIVHNSINRYSSELDYYLINFMLEKGYYDELNIEYSRHYSNDSEYDRFADYIHRRRVNYIVQ